MAAPLPRRSAHARRRRALLAASVAAIAVAPSVDLPLDLPLDLPAARAESASVDARPTSNPDTRTQTVRILGMSEFAGALERPVGFQGELRDGSGQVRPAGGGPHLAATVQKLRSPSVGAAGSLLLSTGDDIGGTGIPDAMLGDRPTVQFLDRLGVDASAVGERELAKGDTHLADLVTPKGQDGCRDAPGCRLDPPLPPFTGTTFPFVSSNTAPAPGRAPTVPFSIHRVGDVRIGVVAATLPEAQAADPHTDSRFTDPVAAVNEAVDTLRFLGVKSVVALVHGTPVHSNLDPSACPQEFASQRYLHQISASVDAIVVGESGGPATCRLTDPENAERVVVAPGSYGRSVSVVDLAVDPVTGRVVRPRTAVFNQTVNLDIAPEPWAEQLVHDAGDAAVTPSHQPLAESPATIPRAMDERGESPLADLICDAQLAAAEGSGAQLALSNPDSLRSDLTAGPVDYAGLHDVQPYGDRLYLVDVTGTQLRDTLAHFADDIGRNGAAVSGNVRYTVDRRRPAGDRVTDVRVDGQPVVPSRSYRVVVNEFLASPEFGKSPLARIDSRRATTLTDIGALRQYVERGGPVRAPAGDRLTVTG